MADAASADTSTHSTSARRRVGLLVTCLVDLMRPSVGFAAAKLLEDAGCSVGVPRQACCGQPAYNSGDRADARALARQAQVPPVATHVHGEPRMVKILERADRTRFL